MKRTRFLILCMLLLKAISVGYAQNFAIKTNILYDAIATPNLGFEVRVGKKSTLGFSGSWNPFPMNQNGLGESNKKIKHWVVQPEYRYYFCRPMYRHFIGAAAFYSEYNIGGFNIPLLFPENTDRYRHEGFMGGIGITYGYHLLLDKRWSLVFDVGIGYAYMEYNNYECPECGFSLGRVKRHYFGPTKIEIALLFMIN